MRVTIVAPSGVSQVPVLRCADALRAHSTVSQAEIRAVDSDDDIDAALPEPGSTTERLVVAGGDGVLRAVVRRMIRQVAPRKGERPAELADDRTIPDLAPLGLLPLPGDPDVPELASSLRLPGTPEEVAAAVVSGQHRRLDLFRNDRGSATLHGALLGGSIQETEDGPERVAGWQARINVDDSAVCDGSETLIACVVANAEGYSRLGNLPLLSEVDPGSGTVAVGVALAAGNEIEVRRARGRAVSISVGGTAQSTVPFTDDGVDGELRGTCTWWVEPSAWALYSTPH